MQYSAELYQSLEAETGLGTGYKQCGGVTVARTPERMVQLLRTAAAAEAFDLECEILTPAQALDRYPILETADLQGAIWLPFDGTANPTDVTQSLAKGARMHGARVFERTRVLGITTKDGAVTGVQTDQGDIEAEIVVNCAGQWAKAIGAMAGVTVPLHSSEHFYVVTDQIDGVDRMMPILRDPDGYTYMKEEVGGLVVGGFEPVAKPWVAPDQIPYPFEFQLLDEDWDHFEILMESALHRVPVLQQTGIKKFYNGPESFTPDNQFILGEAPEVRNFFVGAGFNSVGIASAGGAGRALAAVDRQRRAAVRPRRRRHPSLRVLQRQQPVAPRPRRRGPRPPLLRAVAQPRVRHRAAVPPVARPRAGRGGPRLLRLEDGVGAAQLLRTGRARRPSSTTRGASRTGSPGSTPSSAPRASAVALFDETSFGKLLVQGRDAEVVLQWLCTADVAVPIGRTVYTGVLNARGTYEADVTVTRLAHDQYLWVTGAASAVRDRDWITRHVGADQQVSVTDVTGAYAVLGVMGPSSRALLQSLVPGRPRRRGVPVRHQPGDRPRLLHRAGDPDHLRR